MIKYYVHSKLHQYIMYGANPPDSGIKPDANGNITIQELQAYQKKHADIIEKFIKKSQNTTGRIDDMETFYTDLFFPKEGEINHEIDNLRKIYTKQVNEALNQQFHDSADTVCADTGFLRSVVENEDVDLNKYQQQLKSFLTKSINSLDQDTKKRTQTYLERIEELQNIIKTASQNTQFKQEMEAQIKNNNLAKSLDSLSKKLARLAESLADGVDGKKLLDTKVKVKTKYFGEIIPFDYLQKVIEVLGQLPSAKSDKTANRQGLVGEIAAAMYQYKIAAEIKKINGKVQKVVDDTLLTEWNDKENGVIFSGTKKENVNYDSPFTITLRSGDTTVEVQEYKHTSKVDVTVFSEDKSFPMSVKNYANLYKSLTIVDGTPLSTLLKSLDETTEQFAGHYANLIVQHKDDNKLGFNISAYKQQMTSIIQQQALINGFLGYSQNKPKLFVAFGSRSKQVRVYDIEILIGKILESNNFIVEGYTKFKNAEGKIKRNTLSQLNDLSFDATKFDKNTDLTSDIQSLFEQHKLHVAIELLSLE